MPSVASFFPPHSRVLERIGARALVAHVRTFADFLVYEFSTSAGGQQLNKCIEILNDMVWKYNIVTLDRLILCLVSRNDWELSPVCAKVKNFPSSHLLRQAMRSHENNEAQVCYFIIQLLLLKPNDFRNRVNDFVKENAPEHWLQSDWHNKHMNYHKVRADHRASSLARNKRHLQLSSQSTKEIPVVIMMILLSEIPREAVLWGPCWTSQPTHAAPASVPANLLWQRVSTLPAGLRYRYSPLPGASSCFQVPWNPSWSSGKPVQVPWWVRLPQNVGTRLLNKNHKQINLEWW